MIHYINDGDKTIEVEQLFVYGIFLGENMRLSYGMMNPRYDTVPDFVTFGHHIVKAAPAEKGYSVQLTGLVVDVLPEEWPHIDALEAGYDRIEVETNSHGRAYMYAVPGTAEELRKEENEKIEQARQRTGSGQGVTAK